MMLKHASQRRRAISFALCCLVVLSAGAVGCADADGEAGAAPTPAGRLVSLNPSLTAILVKLGAADRLVGVDDYSADLFESIADRPKVGGLFDPSLESVVSLQPDRVLVVAGLDQQSHAQALERLGLVVEVFENERTDQVLENIERLGRMVGRVERARARVQEIRKMQAAVRTAVEGRERPKTLAIVDRSPLFLVGGETFLDEMMEAAGADNLARALGSGYPRTSIEWLIGARPQLLLDMTPGLDDARQFWSRWPSLPAVAAQRVVTVDASRISMPGPDLDAALRALAIQVHGTEMAGKIDAALAAPPSLHSERSGAPPS